ncbi:hypothetical protein BpHYR1_039246 [Brachionus plicatilis]|uniref:Uncharacterized protein n=1 Tax=Brachionus plicatilis TaxID=10195 RepID=A0A3M7QTY4_BRAPC|nr:hypothetical protein BpHYR1_039246 [Brachionus plicatilis]
MTSKSSADNRIIGDKVEIKFYLQLYLSSIDNLDFESVVFKVVPLVRLSSEENSTFIINYSNSLFKIKISKDFYLKFIFLIVSGVVKFHRKTLISHLISIDTTKS